VGEAKRRWSIRHWELAKYWPASVCRSHSSPVPASSRAGSLLHWISWTPKIPCGS